MNRYSFFPGALVLAALLVPELRVALTEPARNGNIWDWQDHEPVPSEVQKKEQAAGIAPSPQQQQADDRELDSICRDLLNGPCPNLSQSTNGTDYSSVGK
jgi:hypothetical protein